ncbi:MAG TPA: hypothetical protein VJN43_16530 [Bryobacteraceae bacterium]|nr:hypothetical protein [Bryobacteraceae bacterium]
MDDDRKYRQRGYMDSDRPDHRSERNGDERPRPQGPRPPIDVTGPRLPRLVQAVTASRCFNCSTQLANGIDFNGKCPKCGADLHCCKQCAHFEPSTRFQCLKPIPVRIAVKDKANDCNLFGPRVTVARDASPAAAPPAPSPNGQQGPRNPNDARSAFDALFKKPQS